MWMLICLMYQRSLKFFSFLKCFSFCCSNCVVSIILSSRSLRYYSVLPQFSSVQSLSHVRRFATPWTAAHQAALSITDCQSLPKPIPLSRWCHPAISSSVVPFSSCPQSFPASGSFQMSQLFTSGGQSIGFQLQQQFFQWTSFRMDWLDLLPVQGTLKSLLQHHSSKASILWRSAFFIVQLSHPCMTTGKTIALTRGIFVGKVMSLLLNMLSRLVITFLPRSKRLLISWLQSPSAVILEPPKNKVCYCFHRFPIYFPWSDRTICHNLRFLNVEL